MHQSKLIRLLKILSPEEFRLFYKFIRSIYFQNNARVVALYEQLRKHYPEFPANKVAKEVIFAKLFPGRAYSQDSMAALQSKMTKLVEEYLLVLDSHSDDFERKKRLTQIYGKRQQFDFFNKGSRELLEALAESSTPAYREMIDLRQQLYFHPMHNKYDREDHTLEMLMDSLDHYFVLNKMRLGIALKSKQKILNTPYQWRFMEVMNQEEFFRESPVLFQLYQHAFTLLEQKESLDFETFERFLFEHLGEMNERDQSLLYYTGLNFLNRQVNQGKGAFSSTAFRWYQAGLVHHLLIENQQIAESTFGNIVVYGCREKQFNWTKEFITHYQSYLDESIKEAVVTYNVGWLHFAMKEFKEALSILINYPFTEKDQPKTRLTIIRTMFELYLQEPEYYEVLISHIHAFEVFMQRDTLFRQELQTPYRNCIRMIKGLADRIDRRESFAKIQDWFERQSQAHPNLIARNWLIEKMKAVD